MIYDEERTETTLGELIATVSDGALELCKDSREACLLASVVLEQILKTRAARLPESIRTEENGSAGPVTFH
jgi:hypothetical protein